MEEPSDSQALSRLVAEIHQVQPGWRPDRIRRALTDAVAQGRAAPVVAEAMRLVAADPHTRSPQRLHEDGDWWTRAARALRHNDGSPRRPSRPCRTHWGQDEEHCSGCRADALAAPDDHGGDAAAPALPRPDAAAEARRKVSRSRLYGTTRHRETRGPHQAGELLGGLLKGSDGRPVGHPTTL